MKKTFSFLLLAVGFLACNDNDTEVITRDADTLAAPITPGYDNVDGNIPDTSETIQLNSPLPVDSLTGRDSLPRR